MTAPQERTSLLSGVEWLLADDLRKLAAMLTPAADKCDEIEGMAS